LVVSEETGVITLAQKGKLTRDISESQLRKHLTSTMAEYVPIVERLWGHPGKEPGQEHKDLA
jgi:hypothetical protein